MRHGFVPISILYPLGLLLAACGGSGGMSSGGGGGGGGGGPYSVGGSVSGLTGSGLVLQVNAGETLAVSGNGSFHFPTKLAADADYGVTVSAQPGTPTQHCSVANMAGVVGSADVTSIAVTCNAGRAKYLYATSAPDFTTLGPISGFSADLATGALTPVPGSSWPTGPLPIDLRATPDGRFVYVRNADGNAAQAGTISAYAVDAATGALAPVTGSPFSLPTTMVTTIAIDIDPSGRFLYAMQLNMGSSSGRILTYRINQSTGALTAGSASGFAMEYVQHMSFDPWGRYAYLGGTTNATALAYQATTVHIDGTTGELTRVGSDLVLTAPPTLATYSPGTCFINDAGSQLICAFTDMLYMLRVNTATGTLSELAHIGNSSGGMSRGSFIPGKHLFIAYDSGVIRFYRADDAASTFTELSNLTLVNGAPSDFALDGSNHYLYLPVGGASASQVRAFALDDTTGVASEIAGSPYALPSQGTSALTDASGSSLFSIYYNGLRSFLIDPASGALTPTSTVGLPNGASRIVLVGAQ